VDPARGPGRAGTVPLQYVLLLEFQEQVVPTRSLRDCGGKRIALRSMRNALLLRGVAAALTGNVRNEAMLGFSATAVAMHSIVGLVAIRMP
jgi:hypothetical protein